MFIELWVITVRRQIKEREKMATHAKEDGPQQPGDVPEDAQRDGHGLDHVQQRARLFQDPQRAHEAHHAEHSEDHLGAACGGRGGTREEKQSWTRFRALGQNKDV
jgi:hypothetical protein